MAVESPNCEKQPVPTYRAKALLNQWLPVCLDILRRSTRSITPTTLQTLTKNKRLSKSEMPNLKLWHTLDNPN